MQARAGLGAAGRLATAAAVLAHGGQEPGTRMYSAARPDCAQQPSSSLPLERAGLGGAGAGGRLTALGWQHSTRSGVKRGVGGFAQRSVASRSVRRSSGGGSAPPCLHLPQASPLPQPAGGTVVRQRTRLDRRLHPSAGGGGRARGRARRRLGRVAERAARRVGRGAHRALHRQRRWGSAQHRRRPSQRQASSGARSLALGRRRAEGGEAGGRTRAAPLAARLAAEASTPAAARSSPYLRVGQGAGRAGAGKGRHRGTPASAGRAAAAEGAATPGGGVREGAACRARLTLPWAAGPEARAPAPRSEGSRDTW